MSPVLALEGVSKRYSSYRGEWHRFATWLGLAIRPEREFWALRDVNLTLGAGRSLGIIGENGAGKSSLLKIVAGTTVPTEGSVLLRGAASAVLELGLNFDPELHATENVRLFGHLQGMSPAEVRELEPSIRAFADIGDAFDEPMRTYSTGMYARVAFAAATARRPEILVVDEVLSVGDDLFQRKSFDRILEFKAQGTSIVFVSHSIESVESVCDHVIWLERGAVKMQGEAKEVCSAYRGRID